MDYNSLNQNKKISTLDKLKYLETHSEKLLNLFDKNSIYLRNFMEYLIEESETEYLPDFFIKENTPNYDLSLAVIFKVAFFINDSNYTEKQKEAFREEIRQYVSLLKTPKKKYRKNWDSFLAIDINGYAEKVKSKRR